ncbi:hypothetical protein BDD12DRAFT_799739, partial [Trichophaea hybrida]
MAVNRHFIPILALPLFPVLSSGDNGDEFTNNLFSDLAPMLALFGERFAQQFMSQSMGWLDHIIMAMAPLGILTAMVAAIRVGGPSWLKAIVGRARENIATAEIELMSSTSHEVGELWNGQTVVRTLGSPEIQQLVFLEGSNDGTGYGLYSLSVAEAEEYLCSTFLPTHTQPTGDLEGREKPPEAAPNISLNLHGGSKTEDLCFTALCGVLLQFGVLAISGLAVYHPVWKRRFLKNGQPILGYAYPLLSIGTVILVAGMMICSAIVEQSTSETKWPQPKFRARVLWLQKSHTVSDQRFDAFVIIAQEPRNVILTSKRSNNALVRQQIASNRFEAFTVAGVVLSLVGFVLQFQALRGLHWSASISQLAAIFLMTLLRAWVRRGLIVEPSAYRVLDGYQMDWLALHMTADPKLW